MDQRGRSSPSRRAVVEVGHVTAIVALTHLVLAAAVRLAAARLVTAAHGGSSFLATLRERSAAWARARDRGLAATSSGVGVTETAGDRPQPWVRPQTQTGSSGGRTRPRRSAAKKRLTMRSSRVVAQDDEAAAGPQQVDCRGETGLERLQFLVDRDPQGLEDARRGMRSTRLARVRRRHALDERGKLLRRRDRRLLRVDDRTRDPAGLRFLAVAAEQGGQLVGIEGREAQRRERRGWCRIACRADHRHGTRSHARCRPAESSTARGRRGGHRRPRSRPRGATSASSRKLARRRTRRPSKRGGGDRRPWRSPLRRHRGRAEAAVRAGRLRIRSVCPPPPTVASI